MISFLGSVEGVTVSASSVFDALLPCSPGLTTKSIAIKQLYDVITFSESDDFLSSA